MDSVIEAQRRLHEDIDHMQSYIVDLLSSMPRTHRARVQQEHFISRLLDRIATTVKQLEALYAKEEGQREIDSLTIRGLAVTGEGDFSLFYRQLSEIRDHFRQFPAEVDMAEIEFEATLRECHVNDQAFDAMFSGEEAYGRYLDMNALYQQFVNLKGITRVDYLAYLEETDNFAVIGKDVKTSQAYAKYLDDLLEYLHGFLQRTRPLLDVHSIYTSELEDFERRWIEKRVRGWDFYFAENTAAVSFYCAPCAKPFTNPSVFQAHFSGKKHIKAATSFDSATETAEPSTTRPVEQQYKKLAWIECLLSKYLELLGDVREDTKANIERKTSQTMEERLDELESEDEHEVVDESKKRKLDTDENDQPVPTEDRIYNPLKLPLDWDGKPIPYWLWKLHGLGVQFSCEICGNYVYMGRKAFDQHFYVYMHHHHFYVFVGMASCECDEVLGHPQHSPLFPAHLHRRGAGAVGENQNPNQSRKVSSRDDGGIRRPTRQCI